MIKSSKPRKQRKFRYNAPMHIRQNFVNAHIAKELISKLGIRRRSIEVRKGDTVKVMAGSRKGASGKVLSVDLGRGTIAVDGIVKKNAKGKELTIPISASSVYITDLDLSDKLRKAKVDAARISK
jgi:large subunit ribosomal protein L24